MKKKQFFKIYIFLLSYNLNENQNPFFGNDTAKVRNSKITQKVISSSKNLSEKIPHQWGYTGIKI